MNVISLRKKIEILPPDVPLCMFTPTATAPGPAAAQRSAGMPIAHVQPHGRDGAMSSMYHRLRHRRVIAVAAVAGIVLGAAGWSSNPGSGHAPAGAGSQ